ncbi:MAG: hypothetical protein OEP48_05040 [Betaproteobacteria bacterium]|nr:hypothetical protein [Betaproteobacteria bacterium]MDH3435778.1 hypothetical protein [Betaproteobacteria bacterium]
MPPRASTFINYDSGKVIHSDYYLNTFKVLQTKKPPKLIGFGLFSATRLFYRSFFKLQRMPFSIALRNMFGNAVRAPFRAVHREKANSGLDFLRGRAFWITISAPQEKQRAGRHFDDNG